MKASNQPDNFGISMQQPKFPEYAIISKRRDSFKNWPTYLPQDPEKLAEAGFVYTGIADGVRCYHCGKGLTKWEEDDEPWIEHAKWYPDCAHVKLVKGEAFISAVLAGEQPLGSESTPVAVADKSPTETNEMGSVAVQSCLQMGFQQNEIHQAIKSFISIYRQKEYSGADLCEIIMNMQETSEIPISKHISQATSNADWNSKDGYNGIGDSDKKEDSEDMQKLVEENERLKMDKQCKICMDSDASVVFLPCGHVVSCPMCAPALVKCPICRANIKGYIKSYR